MTQRTQRWRAGHARVSARYARFKGVFAIIAVFGALGLGVVGWRLTSPDSSWTDTLYHTLALFVLSFTHEGTVHPLLEVARFLAAIVVFWTAISVAFQVIRRRAPVRRAKRLRDHIVILGDAREARPLVDKYRALHKDVVVIGDHADSDLERLQRAQATGVRLAPDDDLAVGELRRILRGAERVVVLDGDESGTSLLARVTAACPRLPRLIVLFQDRGLAHTWGHHHEVPALCSPTLVAIALVRDHPPFPDDAMAPPPIVLGDGESAAEIVRRIAVGWQQPGEPLTIHCLGDDEQWVTDARESLDGRANLCFTAVPANNAVVTEAITALVRDWPMPNSAEVISRGPTIYVAYEQAIPTLIMAPWLAETFPDAHVVGLVEDDSAWPNLAPGSDAWIVSRTGLLSDPATLELDPRRLLAHEMIADAGRAPVFLVGALGRVRIGSGGRASLDNQPAGVRKAVGMITADIEAILAAGGVRLELRSWAPRPVPLLTPDQVAAVADALAERLHRGRSGSRETRLRLLELAARLPTLAARAGWVPIPVEPVSPTLTDEAMHRLALIAHGPYEEVSTQTSNATGSEHYQMTWVELAEREQRSNIAQVADIPVKLASLGLTWRRTPTPTPIEFTPEQVEELAENEHRRWVQFQYRNGRPGHAWNRSWQALGWEASTQGHDGGRDYDRAAVRAIPRMLASAGFEIVPQSGLQDSVSVLG